MPPDVTRLAKPVNEAADPNAQPPQQDGQEQGQQDPNLYDVKPELTDFESRVSQSTLQNKGEFQNKILSKIGNKQVQLRASKGYGQPEKDYVVNVSGISIDFYYEKYVIIVKGREQGKQKESEYFVKSPYQIKILGNAVVTPSAKKKQQQAPATPVAPVVSVASLNNQTILYNFSSSQEATITGLTLTNNNSSEKCSRDLDEKFRFVFTSNPDVK